MNRRRKLLAALGAGALAGGPAAYAQQAPAKPRRIGYFTLAGAGSETASLAAFRAGMAALGWVDQRDYVIEARYVDGVPQAAPGLASELVATQPDLLLAFGDGAMRPLLQLTKTIPVVVANSGDAVGQGLVASLRRPGGNATGLLGLAVGLSGKRLQLLKEALPRLSHVAILFDASVGSTSQMKETEDAARQLGLRTSPVEIKQPADIEPAFIRGTALRVQAWVVTQGGTTRIHRRLIAERGIALKLPILSADAEATEAGGLMSYGASVNDNFRRAAGYVDKIFKGAKPGELPMEQPTRFELVVNLKTAKAIGITLPPVVMLQADRVIE